MGACLVVPFLWALRFATPERADFAPIATLVAAMSGIIVGAALLFGYGFLAREGFVWFGPSAIGGFVIGLGVIAAVVISRMSRQDDETRS